MIHHLDQGCPTFHLPWATLEDENLVWAAHTFGLGRMEGAALAVLRSPAPSVLTSSCDLRQQRLPASTPVALWGQEGVHLLTGTAQCSHTAPLSPPLPLLPSFPLPPYRCDVPRLQAPAVYLETLYFFKNKKLHWAAL